ncbi:MAG: TolC family protein [Sulfurimonas sp.]|nr:TolC family protein [Sulfurimonas sp.]
MIKIVSVLTLVSISLLGLSLDESVDAALSNSSKLGEIKLNKEINKLNKEQKQGLKYGELSFVGSFEHYNLPRTLAPITPASISPSTATPTTQDLFSVGINYSVALFTGFAQTKSVEIEQLQVESALAVEHLTKEQIIYNVKSIYLSILSLNKQLSSLNDYFDAQNAFVNVIKEEVKLGKKAYIDELKAKNDLESIKANKQTILTNILILKASLKYFIDKEIGTLEDVKIQVSNVEELDTNFIDSLDRLKVLDIASKAIEKKVEIKEASYYPQVSLNSYYGKNFGFNDSTNINYGDFESETIWQIGVKLKYNIYDFGSRGASVESAKVEKLQNIIKKEDIKRAIQKDISTSIAKLNETIANYKNATSQYELLQESVKIEEIRYESGAITINDLLFIKAQKELAKSKMIDSKYTYQKAIYYIEYLLEKGSK